MRGCGSTQITHVSCGESFIESCRESKGMGSREPFTFAVRTDMDTLKTIGGEPPRCCEGHFGWADSVKFVAEVHLANRRLEANLASSFWGEELITPLERHLMRVRKSYSDFLLGWWCNL